MSILPDKWRNISLKWKLLIPFVFLPAALILLLAGWGIRSQHGIVRGQEEAAVRQAYRGFRVDMEQRMERAVASAAIIAEDPDVGQALALADRAALTRRYYGVFEKLQELAGLDIMHFHLYPGTSLLRLHRPADYGQDLTPGRKTVARVYDTGRVSAGLESGLMGYSLRGVAPVYHRGHLVGSVETGLVLGRPFLEAFKQDFGYDLTIYQPPEAAGGDFEVLASTNRSRTHLAPDAYALVMDGEAAEFRTVDREGLDLAVLVGPVVDFEGRRVEVLEISRNRAGALALVRKHALLLLAFSAGVLVLAVIFVYWVATLFLAPIHVLAAQAGRIAAGEQIPEIEKTADDEFGALADAINSMLDALEESRRALHSHARELEARVEERTLELVRSEEKFRTLVENIPLVVYRLEPGLIRTFVSSHIEKLTGWPPEDLVGGPAVWSSVIHPEDRDRVKKTKTRALEEGRPYEIEYRLQDRGGQEVDILDHAEPILDEAGEVLWVEGYMMDVRERKRLEEQSIQAEELKSLAEISTRLAHEFRNPLSVVGLCARRLSKNLAEGDPGAPHAQILLEEVARLEQILKMIQSYIQPIDLKPKDMEARGFLDELLADARPVAEEHEIEIEPRLGDDLPDIHVDPDHLHKVLLNLVRNAAYQMPPRGRLVFSAESSGGSLAIKLVYPAGYLPDDQLRHYFFPFTTEDADTSLVDLPLAPVIIHRHRGMVKVGREGDDLVSVIIDLPAAGG